MSTAESRASELAPAGSAADEAARRERAAQGVHGYSAWDDFESVVASRESVAIDEPAILFEMRTRVAAAAANADDPAALRACAEELRTRTKAMAKLAAGNRGLWVGAISERGLLVLGLASIALLLVWSLKDLVLLIIACSVLDLIISRNRPRPRMATDKRGSWGWAIVGLGLSVALIWLVLLWDRWSMTDLMRLVLMVAAWKVLELSTTRNHPSTRTATLNVVDSFVARHCPDCGFDLSNTPDAIAPSVLEGQRIGPAVCSECTSKWPLLPAGLPAVHRRLRE